MQILWSSLTRYWWVCFLCNLTLHVEMSCEINIINVIQVHSSVIYFLYFCNAAVVSYFILISNIKLWEDTQGGSRMPQENGAKYQETAGEDKEAESDKGCPR